MTFYEKVERVALLAGERAYDDARSRGLQHREARVVALEVEQKRRTELRRAFPVVAKTLILGAALWAAGCAPLGSVDLSPSARACLARCEERLKEADVRLSAIAQVPLGSSVQEVENRLGSLVSERDLRGAYGMIQICYTWRDLDLGLRHVRYVFLNDRLKEVRS